MAGHLDGCPAMTYNGGMTVTSTTQKPQERRMAAIAGIVRKYGVGAHAGGVDYTGRKAQRIINERTDIAREIRGIAQMGRTEEWRLAIERWAKMVEKDQDSPEYAWYAFTQFAILAGYNA